MTIEEYFKKMGSVIGLCELCAFFGECAEKGELQEHACDDFNSEH